LVSVETNLFAGTSNGVFLSTNNGTNWTPVVNGLTNKDVRAMAVIGSDVFVGTPGGAFISSDNGSTWTPVNSGLTNTIVKSFGVDGSKLFAGTNGGVFLSTNHGTSWTEINTGLSKTDIRAIVVSGSNLFAGIYNGGIWRRPLSEIITSIENRTENRPQHFSLEQNYPNPFNPTTKIDFMVFSNQSATLKIFNSLGQEITTLLDGQVQSGKQYSLDFNGTNLPSGLYFYQLQTLNFTETKSMMLIK